MAPTVPFLQLTNPATGEQCPIAFAHRGFSLNGHENSMSAFRAAVDLGYAYVETDVNSTRDGVLVVFHDDVLDRVTDGTGKIADYTAQELRGILIGGAEHIPTLAQVLAEWPQLRLNVDVKDKRAAVLLAALIDEYDAHDRVLVASFSDRRRLRTLRELRKKDRECLRRDSERRKKDGERRKKERHAGVASSPGYWTMAAVVLLGRLGLTGVIGRLARIKCVQVPLTYRGIEVVTPGFIRRCHRAGLQVHVWTIDDAATMVRLLGLGVDAIMTDRADVLADVLRSRGNWPQKLG